jgi:hypothetical protein
VCSPSTKICPEFLRLVKIGQNCRAFCLRHVIVNSSAKQCTVDNLLRLMTTLNTLLRLIHSEHTVTFNDNSEHTVTFNDNSEHTFTFNDNSGHTVSLMTSFGIVDSYGLSKKQ